MGKKSFILIVGLLLSLAGLNILPGIILQNVFDVGIANSDFPHIILMAVALLLVYIMVSYLNYKSTFILNKWSQTVIATIREDVTNKIINLPLEFFNTQDTGYLTARINEVSNLSSLFSVNNFRAVVSIFEFIGACIVLFSVNWKLTIICLSLSPVLFFLTKRNYSSLTNLSKSAIEKGSRLNSSIQQTMQGIEEIKNLAVEKDENEKIKNENRSLLNASLLQSQKLAIVTQGISFFMLFINVVLLVFGGLFIVGESLTIGGYLVFTNYIGKLYAPIQATSIMFTSIPPAIVTTKRLVDFMERKSEERTEIFETDDVEIIDIKTIQLRNVCFKYPTQATMLFNNTTIEFATGDKVFLAGPNGTGKTTFFRLILGLYPVTGGSILINGENINTFDPKSLRKNISVVSQKIFLFKGSVAQNIRYGTKLTDSEYKQYVNHFQLTEFLGKAGIFEDTWVEEGGKNLSGGQVQRIAIARGLIRNTQLFLFDEITANLDKDAKAYLDSVVKNQLNEKICVFIGHNSYTQDYCNIVIDIEELKN